MVEPFNRDWKVFPEIDMMPENKLECFCLSDFFQPSLIFVGGPTHIGGSKRYFTQYDSTP